MLTVLVQSFILASGGMLSVGSITIVLLLLLSEQGLRNGIAYVLGYVSAYSFIGMGVVWLGYASAESRPDESGNFLSILFIIMGLLLLWLAHRNWRRSPSENSKSPRLFSMIDTITPPKAFAFGALVTIINFKNLAIFLSAVSVPLSSNLLLPAKMLVAFLDALVFCTAVIIPVLIFIFFPEQANSWLNWIKMTLEKYGRPIGIFAPLLFSLIFLFRGITGLL